MIRISLEPNMGAVVTSTITTVWTPVEKESPGPYVDYTVMVDGDTEQAMLRSDGKWISTVDFERCCSNGLSVNENCPELAGVTHWLKSCKETLDDILYT